MISRTPLSWVKATLYPIRISFIAFAWWTEQAFVILAWLIALDFILGIIKAAVIKDPITSKKMKVWLLWKLVLLLIPLCIWVTGQAIHVNMVWIVEIAAWALTLAELYSILQNIYIIKTWEHIEEYDAISFVIKKLLWMVKKLLATKLD